jgi:hypothetical protein
MSWGGGQTGPPTGLGGLNRANLARIDQSHEDLLLDSEKSRDNADENDEESLKHRTRENFINILVGIIVAALLIGLFVYVALIPH